MMLKPLPTEPIKQPLSTKDCFLLRDFDPDYEEFCKHAFSKTASPPEEFLAPKIGEINKYKERLKPTHVHKIYDYAGALLPNASTANAITFFGKDQVEVIVYLTKVLDYIKRTNGCDLSQEIPSMVRLGVGLSSSADEIIRAVRMYLMQKYKLYMKKANDGGFFVLRSPVKTEYFTGDTPLFKYESLYTSRQYIVFCEYISDLDQPKTKLLDGLESESQLKKSEKVLESHQIDIGSKKISEDQAKNEESEQLQTSEVEKPKAEEIHKDSKPNDQLDREEEKININANEEIPMQIEGTSSHLEPFGLDLICIERLDHALFFNYPADAKQNFPKRNPFPQFSPVPITIKKTNISSPSLYPAPINLSAPNQEKTDANITAVKIKREYSMAETHMPKQIEFSARINLGYQTIFTQTAETSVPHIVKKCSLDLGERIKFPGVKVADLPPDSYIILDVFGRGPNSTTGHKSTTGTKIASAKIPIFNEKGFINSDPFEVRLWPMVDSEHLSFCKMGPFERSVSYKESLQTKLVVQFQQNIQGKIICDFPPPKSQPTTRPNKSANELGARNISSRRSKTYLILYEQDILMLEHTAKSKHPEMFSGNHLVQILLKLNYSNAATTQYAYHMLETWPKPTPIEALALLGFEAPNRKVKLFALDILKNISDDELIRYMPVVIECLADEIIVPNEFEDFILQRALCKEKVGQTFFWQLLPMNHERFTRERFIKIFKTYVLTSGRFKGKFLEEMKFLTSAADTIPSKVKQIKRNLRPGVMMRRRADSKFMELGAGLEPKIDDIPSTLPQIKEITLPPAFEFQNFKVIKNEVKSECAEYRLSLPLPWPSTAPLDRKIVIQRGGLGRAYFGSIFKIIHSWLIEDGLFKELELPDTFASQDNTQVLVLPKNYESFPEICSLYKLNVTTVPELFGSMSKMWFSEPEMKTPFFRRYLTSLAFYFMVTYVTGLYHWGDPARLWLSDQGNFVTSGCTTEMVNNRRAFSLIRPGRTINEANKGNITRDCWLSLKGCFENDLEVYFRELCEGFLKCVLKRPDLMLLILNTLVSNERVEIKPSLRGALTARLGLTNETEKAQSLLKQALDELSVSGHPQNI